MKKLFFTILVTLLLSLPPIVSAEMLFEDDFLGDIVNSNCWDIPTWLYDGDGTYVGRTQFRTSQNSSLPIVQDSMAIIQVETFNPTGFSFYGTDLISKQLFSVENGIHVTVRAKMDTSMEGIVGGIFLYFLTDETLKMHDEIDFELLTNMPNTVQTNIYSNEPFGVGHPQFVEFSAGSINDFHTYEIIWKPNRVSWLIDGELVRTETQYVPKGPMTLHLNIWVPDSGWSEAYSADLQPTGTEELNEIYWMSVDSVNIQSVESRSGSTNMTSILPMILDD